jgi:outer membrane receptor protein involved in Fe transport
MLDGDWSSDVCSSDPLLRGVRLSLAVNNLFDAETKVRDANGATPLTYQPDYLNPRGRVVQFTVRKLLF